MSLDLSYAIGPLLRIRVNFFCSCSSSRGSLVGLILKKIFSNKVRAFLASPSAHSAIQRIDLSVSFIVPDKPLVLFSRACWRICSISWLLKGFSLMTLSLDKSAWLISNEGFSVVAPISVIVPSSTWGSNASCCALLNLWISSINKMVFFWWISSLFFAKETVSLISFIP